MRTLLAAGVLVAGLTICSGVMHGRLSNRWGPSADMLAASRRLAELPRTFGDWEMVEQYEIDAASQGVLQCAGSLGRRYVNRCTGRTVDVHILLGPAGPIAEHTPEVCVGGTYFAQLGPREKIVLDGPRQTIAGTSQRPADDTASLGPDGTKQGAALAGEAKRSTSARGNGSAETDRSLGDPPASRDSFWRVDFQSTRPDRRVVRFYYAWSTGGAWQAAETPRWSLASSPYLYKLQVACAIPTLSVRARAAAIVRGEQITVAQGDTREHAATPGNIHTGGTTEAQLRHNAVHTDGNLTAISPSQTQLDDAGYSFLTAMLSRPRDYFVVPDGTFPMASPVPHCQEHCD